MKKKIAYSSLFLMVSFSLYMSLFFIYGDAKLENLEFAGEKVPDSLYGTIENKIVWNNKQFLKRLYIKNKEYSYMGYIDQKINDLDIPKDLRYIPYVESSLQFDAKSESGSVGIWQLSPEVAQKFDVKIDEKIDERNDVKISTNVALEYITSLYDVFGSRTLAVAAYHSGESDIGNALKISSSKNYFEIIEEKEAENYLLKILAYKYGR